MTLKESILTCVEEIVLLYFKQKCSVLFVGPPSGKYHVKNAFPKYQFFAVDKDQEADYHPDQTSGDWKIPSDNFDLVLCTDQLCRTALFWRILNNMVDACAPKGYLFFVLPSSSIKYADHQNALYYLIGGDPGNEWADYLGCTLIMSEKRHGCYCIVMRKQNI